MNLEIHNPELVQRVNARIEAGQFHDADEFIEKALEAIDKNFPAGASSVTDRRRAAPGKSLVDVFAPVRGLLTDEEVDRLFSRNPSTSRPLDLT